MRIVSPRSIDARLVRRPRVSTAAGRLLSLIAGVVIVALFATACGTESAEITQTDTTTETAASPSDDEAQAQDDQSDDESAGDSNSSTETTTQSGESKTLDEYLGSLARGRGGPGGAGGGADDALEEQARVEVEVQRCMQAQGFEYVPESVGGFGQFLAQANQGLSPQEFAETKGFGISTRFDEVLDGDVVLEADEEDANDLHLATLSDGEADAWQLALRGAPPERNAQGQLIDAETGEVIQGGRGGRGIAGGCRLEASTVVRGDRSVIDSLADDFDELDARIAADPRIAEITRDWTSCMRDAGFTYETRNEARREINQEFGPLIRQAFGRGGGQQGQGQGGRDFSNISLTPEQDAELQKLQDKEIAIATAAFECDGDTGAEIAEIEARYEAEFVEANRAALESISGS